jgi:hypothetical protein
MVVVFQKLSYESTPKHGQLLLIPATIAAHEVCKTSGKDFRQINMLLDCRIQHKFKDMNRVKS